MNARPRADRIVSLDDVLIAEGMCPKGHGRLNVVDVPRGGHTLPTGGKQMGWCASCGSGYAATVPDKALQAQALEEAATRRNRRASTSLTDPLRTVCLVGEQ